MTFACRTEGPVPAHSRASGLVIAIIFASFACSCSPEELPMAPTALTAGIILYEHANFLGNSAHLTGDVSDLREFRGPCFEGERVHDCNQGGLNDCVSSVRVRQR